MIRYSIGIDIGGTNTDAVLINQKKYIQGYVKIPTSSHNPLISVEECLKQLIKKTNVDIKNIDGIFIGTTLVTNAILEVKNLYKVGLIRIAGHKPTTIQPGHGWSEIIKSNVLVSTITIDGGFEIDGREITQFNPQQVINVCKTFKDLGVESIAIVGVFSPMNKSHEEHVKSIIATIEPIIPVTCSHHIGGLGFIERENATILNAAAKKTISSEMLICFESLKKIVPTSIFMVQNNGTVMSLKHAIDFPILTVAAGPTNSFLGGAALANLQDCIVVDIGGTSTDVGMVRNGFAKRSIHTTKIGDVRLNFPMPDVYSVGIGGGSYVAFNTNNDIKIGPKSCGHNLLQESIIFGGSALTLTDCAILSGYSLPIERSVTSHIKISVDDARNVIDQAVEQILYLVNRMRGHNQDLPTVLVGGGATLFKYHPLMQSCVFPEYANVANAFGAACAQIAATVAVTESLNDREVVINNIHTQALNTAIERGSCNIDTRIVQQEIIPFGYIPGNIARIIVVAAGSRKWFFKS